ncbi:hypothetical protein BH09BAC1_BH09BAC1_15430 [soil metagenome]
MPTFVCIILNTTLMFNLLKRLLNFGKPKEVITPTVILSPTKEEIEESLKQFLNRPQYKILTTDIIDSIKDDDLVQAIFDSLSLNIEGNYENELEWVGGLNPYKKAIYLIWGLESEVNNGGFNQYYYNSTGQFCDDAPPALMLVGAAKFANLVTEANQIIKANFQDISKTWDGSIEGFTQSYINNPLDELDTKFFNLYEEENLAKLQIAFIKANKEQFVS